MTAPLADYHIHTRLCRHASGEIEEYVESAIRAGLEEICFTGHIPLPGFPRGAAGLRMDQNDLEEYFGDIERVRSRYRDITILTGIEADFYEGYEEPVSGFLARYPLDIVLMSVHFIRKWPDGFWVFYFDFPDRSIEEIYRDYCREIQKGIRTGLYDAVAHLDLIKLQDHPLMQTNAEDVETILTLCREQDMSVEINTSGARKSIGEMYPSEDIRRLAVDRGLPFITGSDAHSPGHVGYRFADLTDHLNDLPGARISRYRKRKKLLNPVI